MMIQSYQYYSVSPTTELSEMQTIKEPKYTFFCGKGVIKESIENKEKKRMTRL